MIRFAAFLVFVCLSASVLADDAAPHPYAADADAMAETDAALDRAEERGTRLLLVFGANWCHDSVGLADHFSQADMAALIAEHYELVYVDIGWRERNIDVLHRFGAAATYGTPTVLIYDPVLGLLNGDTMHSWHTAYSRSHDAVLEYFTVWADARPGTSLAQSTQVYAGLVEDIDAWEAAQAERLNQAYATHAAWRAELGGDNTAYGDADFVAAEREIDQHRSMLRSDRDDLYFQAAERVREALMVEADGGALDFAVAARVDASEPDIHLEFPVYPPMLFSWADR